MKCNVLDSYGAEKTLRYTLAKHQARQLARALKFAYMMLHKIHFSMSLWGIVFTCTESEIRRHRANYVPQGGGAYLPRTDIHNIFFLVRYIDIRAFLRTYIIYSTIQLKIYNAGSSQDLTKIKKYG